MSPFIVSGRLIEEPVFHCVRVFQVYWIGIAMLVYGIVPESKTAYWLLGDVLKASVSTVLDIYRLLHSKRCVKDSSRTQEQSIDYSSI